MGIAGGDKRDGEGEAITEVTTDQAVAPIDELEITTQFLPDVHKMAVSGEVLFPFTLD